ncbi:hypothetical protein WR25_02509 [Diploscapter pachys]|uniref:Uncharacterized protein n=1 Tax=Diploscapter pachys TaxID=2018661 RepID=A0A2A2K2J1_9BILA|nr:hypothetical protein WR25_02509 [Diploscapter pachys]
MNSDSGKTIHESLSRRPRVLCLLDRVDNPRQCRIAGLGRHAVLDRARLVDRARIHGVTHSLVHGQALTGDRSLIDRRTPRDHLTIQAYALAWAHAHNSPQLNTFDLDLPPTAIVLLHCGAVRRQINQAFDCIACAIQGSRLNPLGQREQHHDHRRFRPLANERRTRDSNAHQRIDVQVQVTQRNPTLLVGGRTSQRDGQQGHKGHHPLRCGGGEVQHFREHCGDPGQSNGPPAAYVGIGRYNLGCRVAALPRRSRRHGLHAQCMNGGHDLATVSQLVPDTHRPVHHVEFQGMNAGDLLQFRFDHGLLALAWTNSGVEAFAAVAGSASAYSVEDDAARATGDEAQQPVAQLSTEDCSVSTLHASPEVQHASACSSCLSGAGLPTGSANL